MNLLAKTFRWYRLLQNLRSVYFFRKGRGLLVLIFHWLICLFHYCLIIYRQIRVWLLPNITPGLKCCRGGGGSSIQKKAQFIDVLILDICYNLHILYLIYPSACLSGSIVRKQTSAYSVAMGQPKIQVPHTKKIWKKVLPCTTILFCNHQLMYLSINIEFKHI